MTDLRSLIAQLFSPSLRWPFLTAVILAFFLGYLLNSGSQPSESHRETIPTGEQTWTCSMHPQIQQPNPGLCPLCGMDLVAVSSSSGNELEPHQLKLTPAAIKLAAIQTAPVERKYVAAKIRMVGKVEVDETRLKTISAYVPGRIERLYVDYTGTSVRKGDHLVDLYSPDLVSAQEELIQAVRTYREASQFDNVTLRQQARMTLEAVREKLRLWGLTEAQINDIEKREKSSDRLTIYSPISGIVVHRKASEGAYVQTGTPIFTVADLSHLWILLDAYESDLTWLRFGQQVTFTTKAYPGEVFSGRISFIDPMLNPKTRTVKVRVNVDNAGGKLKPEMFVRAVVESNLSLGGKVMDEALSGKWISPMHPEIIKDGPGDCDVCGMDLVRAETLGFVSAEQASLEAPLIIPASAPLQTGKRALVYTARADHSGIFEAREVILGPRSGDYYIVQSGLSEGELVVTHGNFKLDSDLQIRAGRSMMSTSAPLSAAQNPNTLASAPLSQLERLSIESSKVNQLTNAYFQIQGALSKDDLPMGNRSAQNLIIILDKISTDNMDDAQKENWAQMKNALQIPSKKIEAAQTIDEARIAFEDLSEKVYQLITRNDLAERHLYRLYCPMAFDNKGAYWLQDHPEVENPYFGASMFRCGEVKERLEPADHDHSREGF